MTTRVGLIHAGRNVCSLDEWCPKAAVTLLQASLRAEGIPTTCVDFRGLPLCPPSPASDDSPGWKERVSRRWHGLQGTHTSAWTTSPALSEALACRLRTALLDTPLPLAAFYVENQRACREIMVLSTLLRWLAPETHQVFIGPHAVSFGAHLLHECRTVDSVATCDAATTLLMLADGKECPSSWAHIPGLHLRTAQAPLPGGPMTEPRAPRHSGSKVSMLTAETGQKREGKRFALYPLSFSVCPSRCPYPVNISLPRLKSPETVLSEMLFLRGQCNAVMFHLDAAHVSKERLAAFTDLLLLNDSVIIYSLGGVGVDIDTGLAEQLFSSGCRAVGFAIPNGSQRLIEDFYGCIMSVSAMGAAVRRCRAAGLFTAVHLCYPCPWDDYHTRAETELFLEGALPDGLCIEAPRVTPDSRWFDRAGAFGFSIDHRALLSWAAGHGASSRKRPWTMHGWSHGRAVRERNALEATARQMGCHVGVTAQAGLLARIARSVMEEDTFLEHLSTALEKGDTVMLSRLMAHINTCVDVSEAPIPVDTAAYDMLTTLYSH